MSTLVKIRGLARGASTVFDTTTASGILTSVSGSEAGGEAGPASVRGFRVKAAIGRQMKSSPGSVTATLVSGSGGGLGVNANYPGKYGNSIQIACVTGSATTAPVVTTWQAGTANPLITIAALNTLYAATTVQQAANLINSDPTASQFVNATAPSTAEASLALATFSAANLVGGYDGPGPDAEPGPQTQGVAGKVVGEPIFINVTNQVTVVVDTDDQVTARTLMRNTYRFVPLGQP